MYRIKTTKQFDRDIERLRKRRFDLSALQAVVGELVKGEKLPSKNKDHALKGDLKGFRECHIAPDWLLIYAQVKDELILVLSRTGTHSELLKR